MGVSVASGGVGAAIRRWVRQLVSAAATQRRPLASAATVLTLVAIVAPAANAGTAPYAPKNPPLTTPWTAAARSAAIPLREYPRPQLERARWLNLNGRWQYRAAAAARRPPVRRALAQTILVPYPVSSPLSGIDREDRAGWYRRMFRVPSGWAAQHVVLNFGAVSWLARVYVNGHFAGSHRGDYTAFSLDITRWLKRKSENELIVGFEDPLGSAGEPVGKQLPVPSGIWHTPSAGIWQTVWLEPLAPQHITSLDLVPDLAQRTLTIRAERAGGARGARITATATDGRRDIATVTGRAGRALVLHIRHPHLWSPDKPFLYGLRIALSAHHARLDTVRSYFAMRSITLGQAGGATRLLLNGHFVFQTGGLDQGYWPDGLYTPPTDGAMRFDVQAAKQLGYNMVREHVKVEPDRWYYWADKLGLLVWQDMPNMEVDQHRVPTAAAEREFRRELRAIVLQLRSHPSIVMWIAFNEGWEQFDVGGVTDEIKRLDPTRPVDSDSGSADCCSATEAPQSDVRDSHVYLGPFAVSGGPRASVIGEYGGELPYPPAGHRWPGTLLSVGSPVRAVPLAPVLSHLTQQYAEMTQEMRTDGLSGAVFTELNSAERELGIVTFDRRAFTIPPTALRPLNQALISSSTQPQDLGPQPAAVPAGATGSWNFDEGQGTTAADSSGGGHTLTLSGGAGWIAGVHGSALSITGPGQAASGPTVIDPTKSFTVSAWLRPAQADTTGTAVSEPGANGSSFSLGIETDELGRQTLGGEEGVDTSAFRGYGTWWTLMVPVNPTCSVATCGGVRTNLRYADSRMNPLTSGWHQVTAAYDTATSTTAIYVDGIPEDVEHVEQVPAATGALTVGTGSGVYTGSDSFIGAIDQLTTYARALSPGEVWQLYEAQAQ